MPSGEVCLAVGLTPEDISQLRHQGPITVDPEELGSALSGSGPVKVVLFGANTDRALLGQVEYEGLRIHYTCPHCGETSAHPGDQRESYCVACHRYADETGGVS
jgi:hypothetical protein